MSKHQYTPFVYIWTNSDTQQYYIGSRTAKNCHPDDGYICSSKIAKPLIMENPEQWVREILYIGEDAKEVITKETEILMERDCKNDKLSLNMHNGDGNFSNAGCIMSEESKAKMSKSKKGRPSPLKGRKGHPMSDEAKEKLSKSKKGTIASDETRAKISAANMGRTPTEETRKKLSDAKKGRIVSEDTCKRISEAKKGHVPTVEARAKISAANTGSKRSDETKAKMSSASKGKPKSPEASEKMSKSKKGIPITDEVRQKRNEYYATHVVSEETRTKMSETMKNLPKEECTHCGRWFMHANLVQHHGDKCKKKK